MEQFNAENHLEYPVISYFTNPYRQLLLKLCCENNVSLCGILMFQKASPINHPCSQIADYCAWSFLIYHGNMTLAILWWYCKASSHVIIWRQPCKISFEIHFVLLNWHLENAFSFIMCQHLIVIDVLNILKFLYKTATQGTE